MKNKRFKILIISLLIIIFSIVAYISIPNLGIVKAITENTNLQLELKENIEDLDLVSKITTPANSKVKRFQIYEHRGHSAGIGTSYEAAAGNTGIQDINAFLSQHTNNVRDTSLGWIRSLKYDTSIYCIEHGMIFPDIDDILLAMFHIGNSVGGTHDSNNDHLGTDVCDYVEKYYEIACTHTVTATPIDYDSAGIETKKEEVSERDLKFKDHGGKYIQHTLVRLEYSPTPITFETGLAYIVSFNERIEYSSDPSQEAVWAYRNGSRDISAKGLKLFNAGKAVEELANPTTPKMKVTTDDTLVKNTGTIIDPDNDNNYKIGPIYMNDYQYGWSEAIKEFSGKQSLNEITNKNSEVYKSLTNEEKIFFANLTEEQKQTYKGLICGIIYAQAELDNGKIIVLDSKNISYSSQDGNRTSFVNQYYESPSIHGYEYPTPNSTFYITIPRSECVGATKINKITMKYKYTTADGNGGNLSGHFDDLEWTGTKDFDYTQCHYECTNTEYGYNCVNDNLIWSDRSAYPGWSDNVNKKAHTSMCGTTGYCNYCGGKCIGHKGSKICGHHDSSCYEETETGGRKRTCGHTHDSWNSASDPGCYSTKYYSDYCKHGHKGGIHTQGQCSYWGAAHNDLCYGKKGSAQVAKNGTFCPEHGNGMHRSCYEFHWIVTKETKNVHSQNLMYVSDAQVYDNFVNAYIENIPLVANVEINKYVYDVNHINNRTITEYDSTMKKGDFRSKLSEEEKNTKPVYSEFGDYVTFKIEIENNSAFGVIVRATDILPGNASGKDGSTKEAKFYKATFTTNGGKEEVLTIKDLEDKKIKIQANNKASFLVTLIVESLEGTYTNTAKMITKNRHNEDGWKDYVRTIDDNGPIVVVDKNGNEQTKWESKDSYILNDYDLQIDKYVSSYDASMMNENNKIGFTENETSTVGDKFFNNPGGNRDDYEDTVRFGIDESERFAQPFEVEKTEQIVYSIRLTNEDKEISADQVAYGGKQGTQVRPTKVREILDTGLKLIDVKAMIFGSGGEVKNDNVKFTQHDLGNNTYEFEIDNKTILDPGDMLIYFVKVEIEENNMFLLNLENTSFFTELTNINHKELDGEKKKDEPAKDRIVYERPTLNNPEIDRNINDEEITQEYVRLKDLVMAGKVFLDDDKDGYMEDENDENRFNDITVNLYRVHNGNEEKIGTTKTKANKLGENGFYTFERVDKADGKENGNKVTDYYQSGGRYSDSSKYYEYYIEFEYDGVTYKATENYGGRTEEVNPNYGQNNIDEKWLPTNSDAEKYIKDSNAFEFTDVRDEFDENFETIGYNKAYKADENEDNKTIDERTGKDTSELTYSKTGHTSLLDAIDAPNSENHIERVMTARTFIKKDVIPVDGEINSYKDRGVNKSLENTKTLFLFKQGNDYKLPETEYLKYMNLGLVKREDVNVSLAKDLYSITTTVNGEQITYDYNQNGVKNNEILIKDGKYLTDEEAQGATGEEFNETNGKYIDNKNYELELYESDYYYRYEDYEHKAVRDYKTQNSELNIEVTFKITITNEEIIQDELNMKDPDREVLVTIDEVADYYDENFIEYTQEVENAYKNVLESGSGYTDKDNETADYPSMTEEQINGLSENEVVTIKVAENAEDAEDANAVKLVDKKLEIAKAWYYKEGETEPTGLKLSNTSNYNRELTSRDSIYDADGYNKLYIRGFNNVQLEEGESVEIFIKYIVDKEGKEEARNILTPLDSTDSRNLKITEEVKDRLKEQYGRGTEGIGEISAYSTWYKNYDTTGQTATVKTTPLGFDVRPAGLVDRNSNPDNLGLGNAEPNTGASQQANESIDNVVFYEDDTYKTGVTMTVPRNPVPTPTTPENPDPNTKEFIRTIRGLVWDDSRSEPGSAGETNEQYSGNGYLQAEDKKNAFAKSNDNINKNYKLKGTAQSEEKDIMVRNARVDLVEIVYVEGNGTEPDRYYEEVINTDTYLKQITGTSEDFTLKQFTTRTNDDGEYVLYGFKPGYYIVRFGYGDYVEGENEIITDMAIFNGQDYKSTKYTSALDTDDNDTIIQKLEEETNNDARDDEIDRLNTISYSEKMINEKAEILRSNYNYDDMTAEEKLEADGLIETLLRNTAMNAETVRFIVKPEKMTSTQMNNYLSVKPMPSATFMYEKLTNMMNEHISQRNFAINNVNFGIEYRPESQVNLVKEIDNISLVTSDGTELLRIYVNTEIERNAAGEIISRVHSIDRTRSIGLENTQFLSNEYTDFVDRNIIDEKLIGQGFVFINIDEEILQGSTVTIQYRFTAENVSEIDRIGVNLDELRFKDNNPAAYTNVESGTLKEMLTDEEYTEKDYNKRFGFISSALVSDKLYMINESSKKIVGTNRITNANATSGSYSLYDTEYTAAGTASNILVNEMYRVDENKDIYRVGLKKAYYPTDVDAGRGNGYYGRYLGDYYYNSTVSDNDEIAQIKFDKILDYVDNDLVFKSTENSDTNGYWGTTTAKELYDDGYLGKLKRNNVFTDISEDTNTRVGLLDRNGVSYDSVKGTDILRTNLAVSVSDRTKDDEYGEQALEIKNKSISRFLTPLTYNVTEGTAGKKTVSGIKENPEAYEGQILLTVSKLVAQETESKDMTYENVAEVIQFTVTSGRRTNFITTIGNAKIENGEWKTSTEETDTSAAERITFTPPTGLTKTDRVIKDVVEKTSSGLMVIGIIAVVLVIIVFTTKFIITKIKKRPIK